MIHTLTIIRFLFPFLLLLAFFCLYKKPYRCMQSFMWRMVVFDSARKFYLSIMMLTLIWGIQRSGFFNGRGKWAKGFENQRV